MIYVIELGDEQIELKSISDFSFAEYSELTEILDYEFDDVKEQYILLLKLFSDLEDSDIEKIKNIYQIPFEEILKQEIKSREIRVKYNDYKLADLNKVTIDKFIDMEYFLVNPLVEKRLQKITALMYLGKDYDEEEFNSLVEKIDKKFSIGEALQINNLFIKFRENLYKMYSGLFSIREDSEEDDGEDLEVSPEKEEAMDEIIDEEEDEPQTGLGLLEFVYVLSGDDYLAVDKLLEKNLFSIMNYLGWKKEQNDKEIQKQKLRNNIS